jgi:phosphoribosylformylglycinamidine synthase
MPTLGICNGFQILCEAGLLPGALAPNATGRFACRAERLRVETTASPFLTGYARGQLVSFVTSNQSGRYVADSRTVERLNAEDRVAFRYCDADNGSVDAIAGVLSPNRRILGVMPHPDRAVDADTVGGSDGLALFRALTALEPHAA